MQLVAIEIIFSVLRQCKLLCHKTEKIKRENKKRKCSLQNIELAVLIKKYIKEQNAFWFRLPYLFIHFDVKTQLHNSKDTSYKSNAMRRLANYAKADL